MGYVSNFIIFTFALSLFASLTLPPCSATGQTTGCNDAILLNLNNNATGTLPTLYAQITNTITNPVVWGGATAVGVLATYFFNFNMIAMFAPIAAWLLAFSIMPSNVINAFNLGEIDPSLTTLITAFQLLFQVAFALAVLSWFKGGSDL